MPEKLKRITTIAEMGKLPPQAIDFEEMVLSALLIEKGAMIPVSDFLQPECFYKEAHQKIYASIQKLFQESQPIDTIIVAERLKKTEELDLVGGQYYLVQLAGKVSSSVNIEYHARIIQQKYMHRELIRTSSESLNDAHEDSADIFELLNRAQTNINNIVKNASTSREQTSDQLFKKLKEHILMVDEKKKLGIISGVPTTLKKLDEITNGWQPSDLIIIASRPGMGKCLGRGTKLLMFDGALKKVEDIKKGDNLMGDDSCPRKVLSINHGRERMYWVRQNKGMDYRVNESHILSLKRSRNEGPHQNGDILNIGIKDYIEKTVKFKSNYKGYKVGVKFQPKKLLIDPYFLGLWLGDGNSSGPRITNPDKEIINYLKQYAEELKLKLTVYFPKKGCANYSITRGFRGNEKGWNDKNRRIFTLNMALRELGLLNNKHIPEAYLINSKENRLKLLAGFLDTDGYYANEYNVFKIVQKKRGLTEQIKFLADTLGFRTSFRSKKATIKSRNFECEVYRVRISGNIEIIPTKIKRKQARKSKLRNNYQRTGIKIEYDKIDDYYGFEIDGNKLFLLEDMTVTHNTALTKNCIKGAIEKLKRPVLMFSLEMASLQIVARLVTDEVNIPSQQILSADLGDVQQTIDRITEIEKQYQDDKGRSLLLLDDTPALKILELKARAKRIIADNDICLIIIDYLQLATASSTDKRNNREQDVSEITQGLKALAKETNLPVIALAQLSREVERRGGDMRPKLSDLRESGSIEQEADMVIFIYRPDYYVLQGRKDFATVEIDGVDQSSKQYAEFIISKYRHGATGAIPVKFISHLTKFTDWEEPTDQVTISFHGKEPSDEEEPF